LIDLHAVSDAPAKRLWIFVCASLALHVIALSEIPALTELVAPAPTPLTAELVASEPPPPPAPPQPPKVSPPPRKAPARVVQRQQPMVEPVRTTEPVPEATPVAVAEPQTEPEEPSQVADAEPGPKPETDPETPQAEPAPTPAPANAEAESDVPVTGTISYTAYLGSDGLNIGRTVQTWQFSKDSYRLTSFSETTGLIGLFRPYQLSYVSEGRVDASGLRPESFSVRRGRGGERQYSARFDWTAKQLTVGPENARRTIALPNGTLDLLSFIYQLARTPLKPGRVELNITNGNKLDRYALDIGNEETIDLPLGAMRTVPIRQVRSPGQESIEIWLAPERRYLPVRIRFFDREGKMSGEQVASEIASDVR
jgi:hypothetical protein